MFTTICGFILLTAGLIVKGDGMELIQDVNECLEKGTCLNNGTCVNTLGSYVCLCAHGWSGDNCETDIDECIQKPCQHVGSCYNTRGSFMCGCPPQWIGTYCERGLLSSACLICHVPYADISNVCLTVTCQNGGTCKGLPEQLYIDECDKSLRNSPCQNGGTCINTNGNYYCACVYGWTGRNCTHDINECDMQPCGNGGTCVNMLGSYFCMCPAGYTGVYCDVDENLCQENNCHNGGTCKGLPTQLCECPPGWTGTYCEHEGTLEGPEM